MWEEPPCSDCLSRSRPRIGRWHRLPRCLLPLLNVGGAVVLRLPFSQQTKNRRMAPPPTLSASSSQCGRSRRAPTAIPPTDQESADGTASHVVCFLFSMWEEPLCSDCLSRSRPKIGGWHRLPRCLLPLLSVGGAALLHPRLSLQCATSAPGC